MITPHMKALKSSDSSRRADMNIADPFSIFSPKAFEQERFQVYGQSVINVDGMLEKSLAAVIRVPREQPSSEMPNDEPDTSSSGKNQLQYIHDTTLLVKVRKSHSVVG